MPHLLSIGAAGFAGAIARYLVDRSITQVTGAGFPWGTAFVNVTGSFAVGLLFALLIDRQVLPVALRGPLMIGFIGSYTTFSTLTLKSWQLIEDGAWRRPSRTSAGRSSLA